MSSSKSTQCVACKQEIPAGASVCSRCKSFQQRWKNWLQSCSRIVALLVLIATALTWLWANARVVFWYRDDVRLIAANTMTSAVVVNRGDGDAFVSHLLFFMSGRTSNWIAPRLTFEEKVSPGK